MCVCVCVHGKERERGASGVSSAGVHALMNICLRVLTSEFDYVHPSVFCMENNNIITQGSLLKRACMKVCVHVCVAYW